MRDIELQVLYAGVIGAGAGGGKNAIHRDGGDVRHPQVEHQLFKRGAGACDTAGGLCRQTCYTVLRRQRGMTGKAAARLLAGECCQQRNIREIESNLAVERLEGRRKA